MSTLDDKLREVMLKGLPLCSHVGINAALDEAVEQIKQLFQDEGWVTPEQVEKIQERIDRTTQLTKDIVELSAKRASQIKDES